MRDFYVVYVIDFLVAGAAAAAVFAYWLATRKRLAAETVGRAEEQAARTRRDAEREAETTRKEALREAKEKAHQLLMETERQAQERREQNSRLE